MRRIILVLVSLVLATGAYAKEEKPLPEQASKKAKVTIEKVWEKRFDEDIVGIVGGLKSPQGFITEKHKFLPKKLGKSAIGLSLSQFKKEKISRLHRRFYSSRNGKFGVLIEGIPFGRGGDIREQSLQLIDRNGKELWKKPVKGCVYVYVSDDGKRLVKVKGHHYYTFSFYDAQGRLIKDGKEKFPQIVIGDAGFSPDSEYFAIGAKDLILFDKDGNELWRQKADDHWFSNFEISRDSKYIVALSATAGAERICFYNIDGNVVKKWKIPSEFGKARIDISPSTKYTALFQGHWLYFFETETGKLLWKYENSKTSEGAYFVRSIQISEDEEYIILAGILFPEGGISQGGNTCFIQVINMKGEKVAENKFGKVHCTNKGPDLEVNGNRANIKTKTGFWSFKIITKWVK